MNRGHSRITLEIGQEQSEFVQDTGMRNAISQSECHQSGHYKC